MGPEREVQAVFSFELYRPLCTCCHVRPARPHKTVGFYNTCVTCARRGAASTARRTPGPFGRSCTVCKSPRPTWFDPTRKGTVCSNECNRTRLRRQRQAARARLYEQLGNRCMCGGCTWHEGPCAVTQFDVLEVDHTKGNGGSVRNIREDGGRRLSRGFSPHPRYLREIRANPTGHGLVLRCANCHRARHALERSSGD